MLFGVEIYMLFVIEIYLLFSVEIYIYIYILKQNIETLRADLEIRENKQVKDLQKKGKLELENKDYVQTAIGRKREKVRSQRKRRGTISQRPII